MKTKPIYLLVVLLCIVAACKKDTPDVPSPSEPVKKYLAKVLIVGNDGSFYEVEHCAWDSLHRLKTYWSGANAYSVNAEFYYDSIGRISRIDYMSYYRLRFFFDWKNEKELNGMDIYMQNILDTTYYNWSRDTYFYDESGRNIEIKRVYTDTNSTTIYQIEWDGLNITSAGTNSFLLASNQKFDNKYSPWSTFPNILIVGLVIDMNSRLLYNTSKNNSIQGRGFFGVGNGVSYEYEYDYAEDGYPIRQYSLEEDGEKTLWYIFEYL